MKTILRSALLLATAAAALAAAPAAGLADYLADRLVVAREGALVAAPKDALAGRKYLAFYFSAEWCAPCKQFTPKLVAFYDALGAKRREIEFVFISSDRSEAEMQRYIAHTGFTFPALAWAQIKTSRRVTNYGGAGIPCLVVVDAASGKVLLDTFDGPIFRGPYVVLDELKALLARG
jgi:nucleoredoxin